MPTRFLSDDDVWICVCYTRLAALSQQCDRPLDGSECDGLARTLRHDVAYQKLAPELAAETYLQTRTASAA